MGGMGKRIRMRLTIDNWNGRLTMPSYKTTKEQDHFGHSEHQQQQQQQLNIMGFVVIFIQCYIHTMSCIFNVTWTLSDCQCEGLLIQVFDETNLTRDHKHKHTQCHTSAIQNETYNQKTLWEENDTNNTPTPTQKYRIFGSPPHDIVYDIVCWDHAIFLYHCPDAHYIYL